MVVVNESEFKAKALIDAVKKELAQNGAELAKKIKAIYCIKALQGDKVGTWVIDVKNGSGSVRYDSEGGGDVTFTMDDDNWVKLLTGKLSPQQICPHVGNLCNDSGFSPHQVHGLFSYCIL